MNPFRSFRSLIRIAVLGALFTGALPLRGQIIYSNYPTLGSPGEGVQIFGTGFAPGTLKVFFNGVQDPTAKAASAQTIQARVPAGAKTGPITVQVGANSVTGIDDFLVVGLGPYISSIDPPYGAVGNTVIIYGWHLTNVLSVKFSGVSSLQSMPNANGDQITTTVPNGASNGLVTVTTSYGTSNSPSPFTVLGAGPYVTGFEPALGNAGTVVSVYGVQLISATNAYFAGKAAGTFQVQGDGLLRLTAPAGVVSGPIMVRSPKGSFTTATNFFVPPGISGFSPTNGRAGTNVIIRGTNLLGATAVTLAGIPAVYAATNNTNLFMVVPAGARSGLLRVFTPAGSSQTTTNFRMQPVISSFAPGFGAAGTSVVITGANLDEGQPTLVKFGGSNAVISAIASGQLTARVPTNVESGPLTITTTNGTFIAASNFFLPPVITSVTPSNGAAGSAVTIRGTNFLGATHVQFNGLEAAFLDSTNNHLLTATVPTNVITGTIRVTTPAGFAESSNYFYGAPAITGFTPSHGVPGTLVTISGTNFAGLLAVKFNNLLANDVTVTNDGFTIITAVPTNATTGKISVATPGGTVVSSNNFSIDLQSGLSVSIQASPTQVFAGSNVVYQIIVVNAGPFDAPNTIVRNLLPDSTTLISYTNSQGTVQVSGGQVTAALGTLQAQKVATVRLTVRVQGTGTLVDTVSVSSDYPDPDMSDNTNSVSVFGFPLPLLSIGKYSESQWMIAWPALLTNYSLQFNNSMRVGVNWSNLNTVPVLQGTNKFVIEPNTLPSRFYRLKE